MLPAIYSSSSAASAGAGLGIVARSAAPTATGSDGTPLGSDVSPCDASRRRRSCSTRESSSSVSGLAVKLQEVVDALALLVDLVGELAPAPHVVALARAAALLDQLAQRVRRSRPGVPRPARGRAAAGSRTRSRFPLSFLRSESASPGGATPGTAARGEAGSRGRVAARASEARIAAVREALRLDAQGSSGIAALARILAARARRQAATPAPTPIAPRRSRSRRGAPPEARRDARGRRDAAARTSRRRRLPSRRRRSRSGVRASTRRRRRRWTRWTPCRSLRRERAADRERRSPAP